MAPAIRLAPLACAAPTPKILDMRINVGSDPAVELFVTQTEGPAERSLLVIHGGPDWDHSYLLEPLSQLAGTHRVIWPDLRGCGRSTCGLPDEQYNADAAVGDLIALLDVLELPAVDLLGFSTGGMFAQRLALAAPHRIRRMIIASSSIPPVPADAYDDWPEAVALRATGNQVFAGNPVPTPELTRVDALASLAANIWAPGSHDEYRRRLDAIRFTAEWARPWLAGTLPPIRPENSLDRLAALGTPILALHGRQDMTFPARLAEYTAERIPAAHAVVLDQAGHMTHIDQPAAWLAAVAEFLD
jgi:pimeloyl-ACP methyl ester carboxylesterase